MGLCMLAAIGLQPYEDVWCLQLLDWPIWLCSLVVCVV
jgi:hypothetical protein